MYKAVVLSIVLALTTAKPSTYGLAGLSALGGVPFGALLRVPAAPVAAPLVATAPVAHAGPAVAVAAPLPSAPYNYRGPLSLAPGQPANIVALDGRPLDTLSVNEDRALHYTARANDIKRAHVYKRSAPVLAPAAWSRTARIDIPAVYGVGYGRAVAPAVAYTAWRAPVAPIALGRLGAWAHAGPLGYRW